MVHFHPNAAAPGPAQQGLGGPSIIWDTVIAAVASVFSLVMASSVERESPELAAALRFVPAAAGLIWIIRRCLGGPQQHGHYQQPVAVAPVQRGWRWIPQFNRGYNPINWWNNPAPPQPVHYQQHQHYAPAPQPNAYFPAVQRAPAQQQPAILHVAPETRNHFPAVQRAPAHSPAPLSPRPVYQAPPPPPVGYAQPQVHAHFPAVQKAPANPINLPPPAHHYAPQPHYTAPKPQGQPAFPATQRAPAQPSSFPAVNRAAANPGPGGNMRAAPTTRMNQAPATR